jgi:hypothetical protein
MAPGTMKADEIANPETETLVHIVLVPRSALLA